MNQPTETNVKKPPKISQAYQTKLIVALLLFLIGFGGGVSYTRNWGTPIAAHNSEGSSKKLDVGSNTSPHTAQSEGEQTNASTVRLPQAQLQASGLEIQSVQRCPFSKTVKLTGKVSLNQDRIAHIYPLVEGTVDSVSVTLGQFVKKDDLLVSIHSREIGKAKLELYQARLQHEMAQVRNNLQIDIADNSRALLTALRAGMPITEIEKQFHSLPMGDFRERLLSAYSSYTKSQADVTRLERVGNIGAISEKQVIAAIAERNADLASFQARIEQIEYELTTSLLLSSQTVKEAETRVAVAATNLRILGCAEEDIQSIDPTTQGELISHYPIRAPFDGTVITKDVVLREQVRPDVLVLGIADLSTVWITADVYEKDVPLLNQIENKPIRIRNEAWLNRTFEARIFYTGEIMEETTRTIAMRAVADNQEHLLKPGMFVRIELPSDEKSNALQVPLVCIQEHEGKKFVFIPTGEAAFERRFVTVGDVNETHAVILDGLVEGEKIVSQGAFILKSAMLASLMGDD